VTRLCDLFWRENEEFLGRLRIIAMRAWYERCTNLRAMTKAYVLLSSLLLLSACSSSDHVNRPARPSSAALPAVEAPEAAPSSETVAPPSKVTPAAEEPEDSPEPPAAVIPPPPQAEPVASLTRDESKAAQVSRGQATVGEDRGAIEKKPAVNPPAYSLRQRADHGLGLKIHSGEVFRRLAEKGSGLITFQHGKILASVNALNLNEPWCQFVSVTSDLDRAAIYTFTGFKEVGDKSVGFKLKDNNDKLVGVCSSGSAREIGLSEFREVLGDLWTVIHGD
jgi:hypothetical protein